MLKMVDGTGIIGVDMVCPLGGTVSPPQPPNFDKVEMEGVGSLMLPNSLKAPLERLELIGNSTQGENPSPDNPQEIKSAGRKSKNLFNIADLRVGQVQKDGTINEKSTHSRTAILDVPEDGKYRITFNSNDDYTMLYFAEMYTNGVYSQPYARVHAGNSNSLISLKKGKNILSFSTYNNNTQVDFPKDHNIMIAAESETTDYEPYGYLLEMKITGKNLLSNKPTDWQIGKRISWSGYPEGAITIYPVIKNAVNVISLKPSTSYSIINNSGGIVINRIVERGSSENSIKDHGVRSSKYTFVTNQNTMNAILQFEKVDGTELLSSDIESIKIMLVEGEADENAPYEPYTEQTVQIALDEPLRGVGEYKDVLTKDGVARKIAPYEVNLNDLRDGGYSKTNTVMFSVKVQNKTVGYASSKPSILCNILPDCALQMSNIYNNDKECIAVGGGIVLFRVNKSRLKDMSSFEATKQSFIELMADKKMIVEYALETPVTEPLPESVQQQLQALHSENGTTHVLVDSGEVPCGNKLTYRKEK